MATSLDTPQRMAVVGLALAPGAVAIAATQSARVGLHLAVAGATALGLEALFAKLRGLAADAHFRDGSALVTAALIALALPPTAPLWVTLFAVASGLAVGKHAFGGCGANPFNPAMVGYALALVSFPTEIADAIRSTSLADGATGATALEAFKHRGGTTVAEIWTRANGFGALGAAGYEWINGAFLVGGVALVWLRIADWRIPVAMLASLAALAALGYANGGSSSLGSPAFHLFSGATMLTAFFIATDPVTCPTDPLGRALFGAVVGALLYALRSAASDADGAAFAVLLGNAAAPLIERFAVAARRLRTEAKRDEKARAKGRPEG